MAAPPRPSALYAVIAALSWPVLRLVFRLRARGRDHLPAEGGRHRLCDQSHGEIVQPARLGGHDADMPCGKALAGRICRSHSHQSEQDCRREL